MIKIYGVTASRASRCVWCLEEMGQPYEQIPIRQNTSDTTTEHYRSLNPNGRVPAMEDGDMVLFESLAINFYLVQKFGGELKPADLDEYGRSLQWSFWAVNELEALLLSALRHRALYPEEKRVEPVAQDAQEKVLPRLAVLNQALEGKQFLLADRFTIADLNISAIVSWAKGARIDLSSLPALSTWLEACLARPAYRRARKLD